MILVKQIKRNLRNSYKREKTAISLFYVTEFDQVDLLIHSFAQKIWTMEI